MHAGFKWMAAMGTILAIAGAAQAKEPKSTQPASDSEADETVTMNSGDAPASKPSAAVRFDSAKKDSAAASSSARPAAYRQETRTGDFRFQVGLSYVSGFGDIVDYYKEKLDADGSGVPIGLSLAPYYEFAHGSRLGIDLGPAAILMVNSDVKYWDIPLALTYGFTFIPKSSVSPYVRGGIKYHIANGDDVDSSKPGIFGAAGVEFLRKSPVGIGLEVGYDGSEVEIDGETFKAGELLISLRAIF